MRNLLVTSMCRKQDFLRAEKIIERSRINVLFNDFDSMLLSSLFEISKMINYQSQKQF